MKTANVMLFEGIVDTSAVQAVIDSYHGQYIRLRVEKLIDTPKPRIRREKHGHFLTTTELNALRRLHSQGKTNSQIAKQLHRSMSTIARLLKKNAMP